MRIDVHAHYNPPDYFAALRAAGGSEELSVFRALGHIWNPGSATAVMGADKATLKRRLDDMDASQIDKQILSIGAAHPYLKREDDAVRVARDLNDAYAAVLAEAPSRLLAFAMLPLPHVAAALAELDRALARPGRRRRRSRRLRSMDPARRREILAALGGAQSSPRRRLHSSRQRDHRCRRLHRVSLGARLRESSRDRRLRRPHGRHGPAGSLSRRAHRAGDVGRRHAVSGATLRSRAQAGLSRIA